jgi:hypothetical protein
MGRNGDVVDHQLSRVSRALSTGKKATGEKSEGVRAKGKMMLAGLRRLEKKKKRREWAAAREKEEEDGPGEIRGGPG